MLPATATWRQSKNQSIMDDNKALSEQLQIQKELLTHADQDWDCPVWSFRPAASDRIADWKTMAYDVLGDFANPDVMRAMRYVCQSADHRRPQKEGVRVLRAKGYDGSVLASSVPGIDHPLFVTKMWTSLAGNDLKAVNASLMHEYMIGTKITNVLRAAGIPHFAYMYTHYWSTEPLVKEESQEAWLSAEVRGGRAPDVMHVMYEYVPGQSFYNTIRSGKLTLADVRSAIFQLLFALSVAEQQFGLQHGDLHSDNIMLRPLASKRRHRYSFEGREYELEMEYCAVIIDFGLADGRINDRYHVVQPRGQTLDTHNLARCMEQASKLEDKSNDQLRNILLDHSRATDALRAALADMKADKPRLVQLNDTPPALWYTPRTMIELLGRWFTAKVVDAQSAHMDESEDTETKQVKVDGKEEKKVHTGGSGEFVTDVLLPALQSVMPVQLRDHVTLQNVLEQKQAFADLFTRLALVSDESSTPDLECKVVRISAVHLVLDVPSLYWIVTYGPRAFARIVYHWLPYVQRLEIRDEQLWQSEALGVFLFSRLRRSCTTVYVQHAKPPEMWTRRVQLLQWLPRVSRLELRTGSLPNDDPLLKDVSSREAEAKASHDTHMARCVPGMQLAELTTDGPIWRAAALSVLCGKSPRKLVLSAVDQVEDWPVVDPLEHLSFGMMRTLHVRLPAVRHEMHVEVVDSLLASAECPKPPARRFTAGRNTMIVTPHVPLSPELVVWDTPRIRASLEDSKTAVHVNDKLLAAAAKSKCTQLQRLVMSSVAPQVVSMETWSQVLDTCTELTELPGPTDTSRWTEETIVALFRPPRLPHLQVFRLHGCPAATTRSLAAVILWHWYTLQDVDVTAPKPFALDELVDMMNQARRTIHKGPPALRTVKLVGFEVQAEHVDALVRLCPDVRWTLSLPADMRATAQHVHSRVVDKTERLVTFWG